MGKEVVATLSLALASQLTLAAQQGPSDIDVRAAYCEGHLKASRQSFLLQQGLRQCMGTWLPAATAAANTGSSATGMPKLVERLALCQDSWSVYVQADFASARAAVEKAWGKRMKCETSDGSTACELPIAEKKVASVLTPDDGKAKSSLVGCYYFYEK